MSSVPTLGYYKIRAIAQPIRLLLAYKGVKFTDKYEDKPGAVEYNDFKSTWFGKVKFTLGLDFPNLPYYIDGDVKLTQSNAITRHLARKHGLVATDETGLDRQDVLEQQLTDIRNQFFDLLFFNNNYETDKVKYLAETLPQLLDALSRFLGTRQWFTGNDINFVDFMAYEYLDWFRLYSPSTVNKYQNLVQFLIRFESLPAIKAYMKSPEFISWPIVSPNNTWGFTK
ncbi:unnamed protein product [Medioppia subpectinata]|uniref:glutathione transferase n=1 Tax=Medioppia subpectinata TaxID=1979941 RepID=A0A7R9KKY5_9ACAR|nr:unnamed protein product [Medioppia subpectinata]CAG2105507.1 unnamed protein product [Medioppia subpectinata]